MAQINYLFERVGVRRSNVCLRSIDTSQNSLDVFPTFSPFTAYVHLVTINTASLISFMLDGLNQSMYLPLYNTNPLLSTTCEQLNVLTLHYTPIRRIPHPLAPE